MSRYDLSQFSDRRLLQALPRIAATDRATTAELLAHLAEVEARRLHNAAGYSSMHAYCVGALLYSDDAAAKRIYASRVVRAFPVLLEMIVDGRMSLATVRTLGGHLGHGDAHELIELAAGQSRTQIEQLLVERYGPPEGDERAENGQEVRTDSGNKQAPGPVDTYVSAAGERPLPGNRVALDVSFSEENLRLLCPGHDQYEAERRLGRGFMQKRRRQRPLVNHELERREFSGAARGAPDRARHPRRTRESAPQRGIAILTPARYCR